MKLRLFVIFVTVLMVTAVTTNASLGPFAPWAKKLFSAKVINLSEHGVVLGDSNGKAQSYGLDEDNHLAVRHAKVTYDFSEDGGAVGEIALGLTLPAGSIIKDTQLHIETQLTDAGSGELELFCEDAGNIFGPADATGFAVGSINAASAAGSAATAVGSISAACVVSASVSGAALTAGKAQVYLEYYVP